MIVFISLVMTLLGLGILSLRDREGIPGVSVASQEEALSTEKARGTPTVRRAQCC